MSHIHPSFSFPKPLYLFCGPVRWCQQRSYSWHEWCRVDSLFDWRWWRLWTRPQLPATQRRIGYTNTHTSVLTDLNITCWRIQPAQNHESDTKQRAAFVTFLLNDLRGKTQICVCVCLLTSSGRLRTWPSGPVMPISSIRACSWTTESQLIL